MVIAVRIDIDNPFGMATRFRRVLNRLSINYGIVPKLTQLGYLDNAMRLLERLTTAGIQATWFFRTVSTPTKGVLSHFTDTNQGLGLHAEQTSSFELFSREVKIWEKRFGRRPTGFTKHGSGKLKLSRKHDPNYAPEQLVEYCRKAGLSYFIGNHHEYKDSFIEYEDVIFAPSVFWLDRTTLYDTSFSLETVIEDSSRRPLILLVHPVWYSLRKEVSDSLECLIDKCEFSTIEDVLREGLNK